MELVRCAGVASDPGEVFRGGRIDVGVCEGFPVCGVCGFLGSGDGTTGLVGWLD